MTVMKTTKLRAILVPCNVETWKLL